MARESTRRPDRWLDFLSDEHEKRRLYELDLEKLTTFLKDSSLGNNARIYGGVKSAASMDANFANPKSHWAELRRLRDTVRFRIVCSDLKTVRVACVETWQHFLDQIIRCRNYYLTAGGGPEADLYRAVHFELEIVSSR